MAAFVFIHGAGDVGWYWHLVAAELRERGHDTVAPDLPCDDDSAGLPEYAATVAAAVGDRTDLVVVAQSLGGFTAPLVCERVPVELLVLVAPMIPAPGEAPADYWARRGTTTRCGSYDDPIALFYQDVPPELAAEALQAGARPVRGPDGRTVAAAGLARVPTRVLICRDDRLFPPGFLRRVARERLGITPDEIDGGHTPALSRPHELVDRLEAYAAEQGLIRAGRGARPAVRATGTVLSMIGRRSPAAPPAQAATTPNCGGTTRYCAGPATSSPRPRPRHRMRNRADHPAGRAHGPGGERARGRHLRVRDRARPRARPGRRAGQRHLRARRRAGPPLPAGALRPGDQQVRHDVLRRPRRRVRQHRAGAAPGRPPGDDGLAGPRAQRVGRRHPPVPRRSRRQCRPSGDRIRSRSRTRRP